MPTSWSKCSNVSCGYWVTEEWGKCSSKCDSGTRVRKVSCVSSQFCDLDLEPPNQESCNTHTCPTTTTVSTTTKITTTSATTTSTSVPTTTRKEMATADLFNIHEYLPGAKEVSNSNGISNENEKLNKKDTILEGNTQEDLLNNNDGNAKLEEVNLGNGKIVELHEGGFENGMERNMDNIFSEMHISGPKDFSLQSESIENNNELQNKSTGITESEVSQMSTDDKNIKKGPEDTPDMYNVMELGHDENENNVSKSVSKNDLHNNKTSYVTNVIDTTANKTQELTISIKEGGDNEKTNITIPQAVDEDIVDIQSQTGNDKHQHKHQIQGIENIGQTEVKIDIKELGPGRIPDGMRRPLPDLISVDSLLDNLHILANSNGEDDLKWTVDGWTECSRLCGYGVQTRQVWCKNETSGDIKNEKDCDILTKPTAIKSCIIEKCRDWKTSPWNQCSSTCGYAVQKRTVTCPDKHQCDPDQRPTDLQNCKVPACLAWIQGQWSKCSQTCNGGQQIRLVECVNMTSQRIAVGCPEPLKPAESQDCNTDACPNQDRELKKHTCDSNVMSYKVCRALRRMGHCNKMFVKVKCCKTCEERKWRENRPKGDLER